MALLIKDNLLTTTLSGVTFLDSTDVTDIATMSAEVTIIVNTLCRPYHLTALLDSIAQFFPDIPVIVADESKCPIDNPSFALNVEYMHVGYNVGNSVARNAALAKVKTPYFVLVEDVFEFTADTDLVRMYSILNDGAGAPYSLIAGNIVGKDHSEGDFTRSVKDDLVINGFDHASFSGTPHVLEADVVHDFFMARTLDVRQVDWKDELKNNEHWDFFYRFKCCDKLALYESESSVQYSSPTKPVCPTTNCGTSVVSCECECDADTVIENRANKYLPLELNSVRSITFVSGVKVVNGNFTCGAGCTTC